MGITLNGIQRPKALAVNLAGIPAELKQFPHFVVWRYQLRHGKWTKVPKDLHTGRNAKSNGPTTWGTFDQAATAYATGKYDGIGFVVSGDDPFVVFDLDKCRDPETGELQPWAKDVVQAVDSYSEVSPGRRGVRIVARGTLPSHGRRKGAFEVYDDKRFVSLNGHHLADTPHTVEDRQDAITAEHRKVFGEKPIAASGLSGHTNGHHSMGSHFGPGPTDEQIIAKVIRKPKYAELWQGGLGGFSSLSEGDLSIANRIAFFAGPEPERIDRIFRQSGRDRGKWSERSDYRERTLGKALEGKTEFYNWNKFPKGSGKHMSGDGKQVSQGAAPPPADTAQTGTQIILDYLRTRYDPQFHRGNAIVLKDGREVPMGEACQVPTSALIDRLKGASNAPKFKGGGLNEDALPGFFARWSKVAWGDLLDSLPDEDAAELAPDGAAPEEFRRLLREAMLTEITLGDAPGHTRLAQVERRSLIGWCYRFAKPGPWKTIRDKLCWCKVREDDGELILCVAIRHELFAQLKADRRLSAMGPKKFARRAHRYKVGQSTEDDRPHGVRAIVLADDFVADLIAGLEPAGVWAVKNPDEEKEPGPSQGEGVPGARVESSFPRDLAANRQNPTSAEGADG